MDRGIWQATVRGVAESDMTELLTHTHTHTLPSLEGKGSTLQMFVSSRFLPALQEVLGLSLSL